MGEAVRHTIALYIIGTDIQQAAGPVELGAGHTSGVEAVIHYMSSIFSDAKSEGICILLVDASNAFNLFNCAVALQNIQYLCPVFSTILINTYHSPIALFVDGDVLYSNEGTYVPHRVILWQCHFMRWRL